MCLLIRIKLKCISSSYEWISWTKSCFFCLFLSNSSAYKHNRKFDTFLFYSIPPPPRRTTSEKRTPIMNITLQVSIIIIIHNTSFFVKGSIERKMDRELKPSPKVFCKLYFYEWRCYIRKEVARYSESSFWCYDIVTTICLLLIFSNIFVPSLWEKNWRTKKILPKKVLKIKLVDKNSISDDNIDENRKIM